LEKYRDNPQITMIGGSNIFKLAQPSSSYFFSRYVTIWGWATWKRAWQKYDVDINDWPQKKKSKDLSQYFINSIEEDIFSSQWNDVYYNHFDTWDYQWDYCRFFSKGIGIIPNENLITNLGFGKFATHTKDRSNFLNKIPLSSLTFPLIHPYKDDVYTEYDEAYFKKMLYKPRWKIPFSNFKKIIEVFKVLISLNQKHYALMIVFRFESYEVRM
jgi:hypothetical protein